MFCLSDRKNQALGTVEYDVIPLSKNYSERERAIKQQMSGMGKTPGQADNESFLASEESKDRYQKFQCVIGFKIYM